MATPTPPARRSPLRRFLPGDPAATAIAILFDAAVVGAALAAGLLLRFDGEIPRENWLFTLQVFPGVALVYIGANVLFGVYRTIWTYASVADALNLLRSVGVVTALIFGVNALMPERDLPLSVVLIAGILIFPGMATVKMRTRIVAGLPWSGSPARRLLIVGAGRTGQLLARSLQHDPGGELQPVGFVDDDADLVHSSVIGLRVLGTIEELDDVLVRRDVELVAVALPRSDGRRIREVLAICQARLVPVRIVPGVEEWTDGRASDPLRTVTLDDLLDREPVEIDYSACAATVSGRSVLVTGAAGSIGSELCRQIVRFGPRTLHVVDNNETGLYDLALELAAAAKDVTVRPWVANVADAQRVDAIFAGARPDIVYHAAALKHVPLMEDHPGEAFRVNVLGTRNVARAALQAGTATFVLISTDKAVRPASIMGASKRIAELQVLALARESAYTRFAVVRFGNVIGSRGSVVPTFMRQIERGGPVTVMHPDMMRYFISIPEAVSLVIQAGTFAENGDILMLDMGEEVNILELAERIIRLRGLRPGHDIEVVFTGPRPGEKLREELVGDIEHAEPTAHRKVMRLRHNIEVSAPEIDRLVDELGAIMWGDVEELRQRLHLVARTYGHTSGAPSSPPSLPNPQ